MRIHRLAVTTTTATGVQLNLAGSAHAGGEQGGGQFRAWGSGRCAVAGAQGRTRRERAARRG